MSSCDSHLSYNPISTYFDIICIAFMGKYPQTLQRLDLLIARLQANTGGEPLLPENHVSLSKVKIEKKVIDEPSLEQELKVEIEEEEKK